MLLIRVLFILLLLAITCSAEDTAWIVGNVQITGNNYVSRGEILDRMDQRPSGFFRKRAFSFINLLSDINAIGSLYRSKGFLKPVVNVTGTDFDSANHRVTIHINIHEGCQTTVCDIKITGKTSLTDSQLLDLITLKKGEPLDSTQLALSKALIADTLLKNAFWFADVQFIYQADSNSCQASVSCFINRGPKVIAGKPVFQGFDKVKSMVAERELKFEPGKPLESTLLRQSMKALYETDLFTSVIIQPLDTFASFPTEDSVVLPVLINVEEKRMLLLNGGGGYDSYEHLYLSVSIGHKNLFSLGHRLTVETKISSYLNGAYLRYYYPWFLNKPVNLNVNSYIEKQDQKTFRGLTDGGTVTLSGGWGREYFYAGRMRLEHVQYIHPKNDTVAPELRSEKSTLAFGVTLRQDTRNNLLFPGAGTYASFATELAGPFMRSTNQFYKLEVDMRFYQPVGSIFTLASALYAGQISGYGADKGSVPPQELFRPGQNSVRPVRGYNDEELGPLDKYGNYIGGNYCLIVNLIESRFVIYKWIIGAFFVDGGGVWSTLEGSTLKSIQWSAGPGLLLNLPIGLVRLDYGIQLHRNPEGRILLSIGVPF